MEANKLRDPIVVDLHGYVGAVSRAAVSCHGRGGSAPDSTVGGLGGLVEGQKHGRVVVGDASILVGTILWPIKSHMGKYGESCQVTDHAQAMGWA